MNRLRRCLPQPFVALKRFVASRPSHFRGRRPCGSLFGPFLQNARAPLWKKCFLSPVTVSKSRTRLGHLHQNGMTYSKMRFKPAIDYTLVANTHTTHVHIHTFTYYALLLMAIIQDEIQKKKQATESSFPITIPLRHTARKMSALSLQLRRRV